MGWFFNSKKKVKQELRQDTQELANLTTQDRVAAEKDGVIRRDVWSAIKARDFEALQATIENAEQQINWDKLYAPGQPDTSILNFVANQPYSEDLYKIAEFLIEQGAPLVNDNSERLVGYTIRQPLEIALSSPSGKDKKEFVNLFTGTDNKLEQLLRIERAEMRNEELEKNMGVKR